MDRIISLVAPVFISCAQVLSEAPQGGPPQDGGAKQGGPGGPGGQGGWRSSRRLENTSASG